jgi:P-type Cu+ transporter
MFCGSPPPSNDIPNTRLLQQSLRKLNSLELSLSRSLTLSQRPGAVSKASWTASTSWSANVRLSRVLREIRWNKPLINLEDPIGFIEVAGQSILYVSIDGKFAGLIGVSDAIKPSAKSAIDELHKQGIEVVMMTGDNRATADAVAKELGIDHVFAEVMPEDKAAKVKELQAMGKRVAMAGDGVNDAPALAQADVGIAFASGTDVAIESADITLLKPDLGGILKTRNLSRETMKNIRQNLFFAFAYNVLGVPIAAGVLFPVFGVLLSPMIASAAMTFSSVSVIANALRLRRLSRRRRQH